MSDASSTPEATDSPASNPVETSAVDSPPADSVEQKGSAKAIPDSEGPPPTFLGLSRSDGLFVGVIGVVLAALLIAHWLRLTGWGLRDVEIVRQSPQPFDSPLDLNRANWVELSQLEGVGETLARRIVEHREQNGAFASVDELRNVKGIGVKTLEKLKPWLRVGSTSAGESLEKTP